MPTGKASGYSECRTESLSLGELQSVSYCLNPKCPDPSNQPNPKARVCPHCGSELCLRGRYRITQVLGGGGFGRTFEIEENGDLQVLKVLYKNHPKAVALFQQEAKVLSRLNHPGIPRVEEDGYFMYCPKDAKESLHCLVMEKIEGSNLMDWLKARNHKPIDEAQAMIWLKQLVEILGQVHQQHYFHRDIKPHNIMRRPEGQLALIDFGTAREVTGTYLNKVGGGQNVTEIISAGYTPPEQINGKAVPQSDFYALGRTFVYLLTGKRPTEFPENPRTGKLLWRDGAPHVSNELASVIDYMMAPFPGNRPQHAQMILKSLAEAEDASSTSNTSGGNTLGRSTDRTGSSTASRASVFEIEVWRNLAFVPVRRGGDRPTLGFIPAYPAVGGPNGGKICEISSKNGRSSPLSQAACYSFWSEPRFTGCGATAHSPAIPSKPSPIFPAIGSCRRPSARMEKWHPLP